MALAAWPSSYMTVIVKSFWKQSPGGGSRNRSADDSVPGRTNDQGPILRVRRVEPPAGRALVGLTVDGDLLDLRLSQNRRADRYRSRMPFFLGSTLGIFVTVVPGGGARTSSPAAAFLASGFLVASFLTSPRLGMVKSRFG